MPFFLKAPGQVEGTVVDDVARPVDLLPTLIDVLDIETDWDLRGPLAPRRQRADGRARA